MCSAGVGDEEWRFAYRRNDRRLRGDLVLDREVALGSGEHDTVVGTMYPLAAGVDRQVTFAPAELPKFGALGTFGLRGPDPDVVDMEMPPPDESYNFATGKVYNLESSQYIFKMEYLISDAHSDLGHPTLHVEYV